MVLYILLYILFHLGQTFCQLLLDDTFHQRLLIDQVAHIVADEPLGDSLQFCLMVWICLHRFAILAAKIR